MKDLLVQAEVDVTVEHNEVITVLSQQTYWADEGCALSVRGVLVPTD